MSDYMKNIVKSEDLAKDYEKNFRFRAFIGGPSKTGKTTLVAATAPGKKLIIDTDNRWRSVSSFPNVSVLPVLDLASSQSIQPGISVHDLSHDTLVKAWNILYDINNELWLAARKGTLEFDTICPDGLSSMNRLAMAYILSLKKADGTGMATGPGGGPGEHHYGPQMHVLSMLLISLNALPSHFIISGHLELVEDRKTGETQWFPRMFGKTRHEIGSWYDECYETERQVDPVSGTTKYFLRTVGYGNKTFLGSSMNTEGKYWKSPFEVKLHEKPAGIEKLIQLRFNPAAAKGEENKPLNQTKLTYAQQTK